MRRAPLEAAPASGRSGHRARKRFGQHFLERTWIDKVVGAVAPASGDVFLEIWPGHGALTRPLLAVARHVVAFEIDRDLAAALRSGGHANLTVVEGDFLRVPTAAIEGVLRDAGAAEAPLRVAGNLPYNVASPMLFRCVAHAEAGLAIRDATVMLQREVARRILARAGTAEYGVLSVLLQQVADVAQVLALPPGAFRPAPRVHSALLRLRFHPAAPAPNDLAGFRALVRALFTRRRKTLVNALAAALSAATVGHGIAAAALVDEARLDGRRRPETLDLEELVGLANVLTRHGSPKRISTP